MNTPGLMGDAHWTWRFDWAMVSQEPGHRLGRMTAASGRGPIALLHLPPLA